MINFQNLHILNYINIYYSIVHILFPTQNFETCDTLKYHLKKSKHEKKNMNLIQLKFKDANSAILTFLFEVNQWFLNRSSTLYESSIFTRDSPG